MRLAALLFVLVAQDAPKKPDITLDEFAGRRTRLLERLADGVSLLDSGPLSGASSYDFKYLTNHQENDGIVVFSGPDKAVILFVKDPKTAEKTGIKDIRARDTFEEWAAAALPKADRVYTKLKQVNLVVVKKHSENVESGTLGKELTRLRLIKSKVEQDLVRYSTQISARAHVRTMKTLKPGLNEKDIQKIYEEEFKKDDAPPGYGYICGSGINGCVLHYSANNQEIAADTLMVNDCGAAYKGYVADVTRTFPTSGKFSKEQAEKYQLVRDAQKAAEKILKPGVTLRELHAAAAKVFEDSGHTKWAFSHSKDGSVKHGLGHFVGLYVHDSGAGDTKMEPGMVITIEPGWYDKDQKWGIRIEDMYLVTEDGYEHLSKDAPREIVDIEKAMGEGMKK
jgi:Xaa-Pro aminopeptidase